MNKTKVIIYSILLFILVAGLGYGIYAAVAATRYKNNEVSFKVNNEEAYFMATGKYFYGESAIESDTPSQDPFSVRYTIDDYYSNNKTINRNWNVGNSSFVIDDDNEQNSKRQIKFVIEIQNLNENYALGVKLREVGVQKDNYFLTKIEYKNGDETERHIFDNNPSNLIGQEFYNKTQTPNKVDILTEEEIAVGKTLTISVTFTLNTKTNAFTVINNMQFELAAKVNG